MDVAEVLKKRMEKSLEYQSVLHFGDFATDYVYCPLKAIWRWVYGPRLSYRAFIGKAVHEAVEKLADESEVRISKDGIDARIDMFVEGEPVEMKFVPRLPDRPREHHRMQASIYVWMLDRPVHLLYVSPDGMRDFLITESVNPRHVDRRIPMWPWECKFCEYRDICRDRILDALVMMDAR